MVYMLLADGFEEIEAIFPLDVLRRCGVEVKTVSVVTGDYVTGSGKITVKADMSIDDISVCDNIDMLILPGGPGRINLRKSSKALELIKRCFEDESTYVAAICGAPEILGELSLLHGKKATCYPGLESKLIGAEYIDAPVVIDGKLITSQGAGTAEAFSFTIAEYLCGKETAYRVYTSMQCGKYGKL